MYDKQNKFYIKSKNEDTQRCIDIIKNNIKNGTIENLSNYDFYKDIEIIDNMIYFSTFEEEFEFKI